MQKTLAVSLLLLTASTGFEGCARVTMHPIEQTDIVQVKAGDTVKAPKDGAFLSQEYIQIGRAHV